MDAPVYSSTCLMVIFMSTYCKETSGTWTLDMRVVDPSTGRIMYEQGQIDETKWTPEGGTWNVISAMQPDGVQGHVAVGSTSSRQILKSSFTGTDYILEGYGKQISSVVWGFGIRTTNYQNTYSLNLYDNHDATDNYYFYRWSNGTAIDVWKTALGTINPNTWYKLMIKAYGSNFDIYFNNVYRATTSNTSFSSGSIALYGESGAVAQFDDIRVRKYVASEPIATVGEETTNATVYDVYLSSNTSAAAGILYPNTNWGVTSHEPDDWNFTSPISLYIVPEVGSVFGASDITIQWDNTMYSYAGVENTGIYSGANFQSYTAQTALQIR